MIAVAPKQLLLEANVSSTLREKARIIEPIKAIVTVTPDFAKPKPVNDESQPYRTGIIPLYKDKAPAISTSKLRIEYKYLQERLSSKYVTMVLEGIDCLRKIGHDLRYYYSTTQQLVRGLDDERQSIREACVEALKKLGTRRLEKSIEAQVKKTLPFLTPEHAASYTKQIEEMWMEIDKENNRRLAMIRIYEDKHPVSILNPNVPQLFVFHVDYKVNSNKAQAQKAVLSSI